MFTDVKDKQNEINCFPPYTYYLYLSLKQHMYSLRSTLQNSRTCIFLTGTKAGVCEACALCTRRLGLRCLSNRKDKTTVLQSTCVADVFLSFFKKARERSENERARKIRSRGKGLGALPLSLTPFPVLSICFAHPSRTPSIARLLACSLFTRLKSLLL